MAGFGQKRLKDVEFEKFSDLLSDALNRKHKSSNLFYVDSNTGNSAYNGLRMTSPFATLAQAYAACTASQGDQIILLPNHAETTTAVLTASKADVTIKGLSLGAKRPTITGNSTADTINLTGAGQTVENILFAAPETDAQTADINVAAANCLILNTKHIGSKTSNNKVDIITMTASANDVVLDGVRIYNTVVECVGGIVFEGALARAEVRNCAVFDSIGFTDGCISDEATATNIYIHHNVWQNAKAGTAVMNWVTNSTGICSFNHISGRHTTIASNVVTGTGMDFFENRVTEQAQVGGAISVPTVDVD